MPAYYNEIDKYATQWLRNLIAANLIVPGDVDERSITEVNPDDLIGYTQCHFFAGIGVWSHALRRAGWADDRPIWTGSCPCQSFSAAGKQLGFQDPRHLWPSWFRLLRECKPSVVFGEQVAAAIRHGWLDLVQTDLEGEGYSVGKAVLGAASVGAPHIRQRLWFVADSQQFNGVWSGRTRRRFESSDRNGDLGYSEINGSGAQFGESRTGLRQEESFRRSSVSRGLVGNASSSGLSKRVSDRGVQPKTLESPERETSIRPGPVNGFWSGADWIPCKDSKWRPVEPGTFPLVDGSAYQLDSGEPIAGKQRQVLLKGYGNALCAPVATEFISAYMSTL